MVTGGRATDGGAAVDFYSRVFVESYRRLGEVSPNSLLHCELLAKQSFAVWQQIRKIAAKRFRYSTDSLIRE